MRVCRNNRTVKQSIGDKVEYGERTGGGGLSFLIVMAIWILGAPSAWAQPVTLHFEEYPGGTRIDNQYQPLGAHPHFMNDYQPDVTYYRASPIIEAHSNAKSGSTVLVNGYSDLEFHSSATVPLVVWFEQPVSGVGMWLGTRTGMGCSGGVQAKVSIYDGGGALLEEKTATASSAFNTPLELDDTLGRIRKVAIDYGDSLCPEAIDEFAFQSGSGQTVDTTPPQVTITSHTNFQTVAGNSVLLAGTVQENSGILTSVMVNDSNPIPFYPVAGGGGTLFQFSKPLTLHGGSNAITVAAYDGAGNKGKASLTLNQGTPADITLKQFHLTQRGIMQNISCDVDGSGTNKEFVAGKSAVVRIFLDVKTVAGDDTYVSSVELRLYRKEQGVDLLVDTFIGSGTSPFISNFKSPSEMAGIHFYIPGDKLDPAGEYKFEVQAYVGVNPVYPKVTSYCGGPNQDGDYFTFVETKPVRIFIVPVEAANTNPHQSADHVKNYYSQLETLARTFPVRDGYSQPWENRKTGVYFIEGDPLRLCDGSEAMHQQYPQVCEGSGWTWRLTDKDPGGILRRANHFFVYDPNNPSITCGGNPALRNQGGMVTFNGALLTGPLETVNFVPDLGLFRPGSHPEWDDGAGIIKYYVPIDDDHDGQIGPGDLQHFVAEYYDNFSKQWLSDLTYYNHGETYRFFRDQDGNQCQSRDEDGNLTEPQADVVRLWENAGKVAYHAAEKAMDGYYASHPVPAEEKANFASLWFPTVVHPDRRDFNFWGPGSSTGRSNWIRVTYDQTMAHEMGHNVGGLKDTYHQGGCFNPPNRLNAWNAFIGFESVPAANIGNLWDVMDCSRSPEQSIFNKANYDALFDKLKVSTASVGGLQDAGPKLLMAGRITNSGQAENVHIQLSTHLEATVANPFGPYLLRFGAGSAALSEFPFAVDGTIHPPQGVSSWPLPFSPFRVVAPVPGGTEWVELRNQDVLLKKFVKSAKAPTVQLLFPQGGESFGANDEVTIRWTSGDADGDPLVHTLYYSPDGISRWMPIASGVAGNEFRWKLADFPGTTSNSGLIRIVASDGFNTGEHILSAGITVAGKPPQAAIFHPEADQVFLECQPIRVRGMAREPQGQLLFILWYVDDVLVDWSFNLNPVLGPLAPGVHKISLVTFNVTLAAAVSSVSISVLADSDCDGMSDYFEELHGLNPYFAEDARLDPDQDGMSNLEEAWRGTDPDVPELASLTIVVQPAQGGIVKGDGIDCPGVCGKKLNYDVSANLTAGSKPGFAFAGWENCDIAQGESCTAYVYGDRTITAIFEQSFFHLHLPIIFRSQ